MDMFASGINARKEIVGPMFDGACVSALKGKLLSTDPFRRGAADQNKDGKAPHVLRIVARSKVGWRRTRLRLNRAAAVTLSARSSDWLQHLRQSNWLFQPRQIRPGGDGILQGPLTALHPRASFPILTQNQPKMPSNGIGWGRRLGACQTRSPKGAGSTRLLVSP